MSPNNTMTATSTTSLNITELLPAMQAQFYFLIQQYNCNATLPPAQTTVQHNLPPLPDYDNITIVLTSMQQSNFNNVILTFSKATSDIPTSSQPLNTLLYELNNQYHTAFMYQLLTMMGTFTMPPLPAVTKPEHIQSWQLLAPTILPPQQLLAASNSPLVVASNASPLPAQLKLQIVQGEYANFNTQLSKTKRLHDGII